MWLNTSIHTTRVELWEYILYTTVINSLLPAKVHKLGSTGLIPTMWSLCWASLNCHFWIQIKDLCHCNNEWNHGRDRAPSHVVQYMTVYIAFLVIGQHESSRTVCLPGHIHSTTVSLVVHHSEDQTVLLDIFRDSCACNCGITQEKLQEFLTDLLSGHNLTVTSVALVLYIPFAYWVFSVFPRWWQYLRSVYYLRDVLGLCRQVRC